MTTQQKLTAFYKSTNEIIDMLRAERPIDTALESINWDGDYLCCNEARFVTTNFDDEYWEIAVSGASPDALNLRARIQLWLIDEFPEEDQIYVVIQW